MSDNNMKLTGIMTHKNKNYDVIMDMKLAKESKKASNKDDKKEPNTGYLSYKNKNQNLEMKVTSSKESKNSSKTDDIEILDKKSDISEKKQKALDNKYKIINKKHEKNEKELLKKLKTSEEKLSKLQEKIKRKEEESNSNSKPDSAFSLYKTEILPSIKNEHTDTSYKEQSKLIKEKWRNLSENEKENYVKKHKLLVKKFKLVSREGDKKSHKRQKTRQVDENGKEPKRNISSYMHYIKHVRANEQETFKDMSAKDFVKWVASKWNALSTEDRERQKEIAEKDKIRQDAEISLIKNKKPIKENDENNDLSTNDVASDD